MINYVYTYATKTISNNLRIKICAHIKKSIDNNLRRKNESFWSRYYDGAIALNESILLRVSKSHRNN